MTRSKNHLLAYFGHHKAATTWINAIIVDICNNLGWKTSYVSNANMFNHNLKEFATLENVDFLCYTNADFFHVSALENFKGFHVIRDPRDLITSAYFSHLYSHPITKHWPELKEHRRQLKELPKDEGIILEMKFSKRFLEEMYNWNYNMPNILEIKMEYLVSNPYINFLDVFDFLGVLNKNVGLKSYLFQLSNIIVNKLNKTDKNIIPLEFAMDSIPAERLLGIVFKNEFSRLTKGRKSGDENVKSHYRKGVSGDWKNHFKQEHIEFFKDNYNEVLLKLGYESDPKWWENLDIH